MVGDPSVTACNDDIMRGLRERSPEVLDRLFDENRDSLFRYLLRLTGNRHTAEDLFQETWLRVLQRGHQYRGTHSFRTWLFAVAKNLVIDLYRRQRPLASLEVAHHEEPPFQLESLPADNVIDRLHREALQQCLHAQVSRLPLEQQEVLLLRANEGLALKEIASVTNMPLSRVKHLLYQAVSAIRTRLLPDRRRQSFEQVSATA